jgi:radical SAM protein with 4Fe4S-binding SPASM domain
MQKKNMTLLDKLYYRNLNPKLPHTIMIEPTNACNLKCFMCDYQKQYEGKRSYLSLKDFESIIAQFHEIKGLVFCGIGEPLLNKNIIEMISIAVKGKIPFINLITNGILLGEECFRTLMKSGLTRIQISFHSTDLEIASRISGMPSEIHSRVRDNIVNALKIRNTSDSKLQVVLNSVINIENCNDLFNLIEFCEDNRIDEINFIQLTTIFGKYDSFNIGKDKARSLIRKIKARLKKSRLKGGFLSGNGAGRCYQLWNFIMIHADGTISPCNGIMPHEKIELGNLIHEDISQLWHSDKYIMLRKSVIEKRLQNCEHCEVGYLLEGKNFEWFNNYYLKPLIRNLYARIRNE